MQKVPYFVGLDIGTSRVRCAIGMPEKNNPDNAISVIGVGSAVNLGMRKGYVAHPEDVTRAITEAVGEAERMAGVRADNVVVNVNGASVKAVETNGMVSTNSADRVIGDEDRARAESQAIDINMPNNRDIIKVFAKNYRVDGQDNIKDPVGMRGNRLEVDTLVVTAGLSIINALDDAIRVADMQISEHTVSGVANSEVILNRQQRESGVAVVDIGSGTINIIIVEDGEIHSINVIPIGGMHVTQDLAIGLKIDLELAEKMKIKVASLKPNAAVSKKFKVTHEGKHYQFDTETIYNIVAPRFEEMFDEINKVFAKAGRARKLPGGVLLVGGVANTPGIADFSREQLQLHTRIGKIKNIGGLTDNINGPEYSTVVGLMVLDALSGQNVESAEYGRSDGGMGMFKKIKGIIKRS